MDDATRVLRAKPHSDMTRTPEPGTVPTILALPAPEPESPLPTFPSAHEPVALPAFQVPVSFPGYDILGEVGRGGMGVVYKARQQSLNRLVALKVILAGPHASPADCERFKIEAEAAARLRHPNVVQVFDVGEHAGFPYIAFELVEGQTLRAWQDGKPADPREAARIVAAVARAIDHAHALGVVHRDLKPANVLLSAECGARSAELKNHEVSRTGFDSALRAPHSALQPKVTDFGLAKLADGNSSLTITGMACGTPNYMAPEQVRGQRNVGPAVDVYGLGTLLYELLTGSPPFAGTDPTAVMDRILRTDPAAARTVNPAVPRDLDVIAAKCLEKNPARRYPSAAAVADDLGRFLAGRPISARPVRAPEKAWRWCRRNPVPALMLAATTVGCLLTGGLAVALARSVAVEQTGHDEADAARKEAEHVRDDLRDALAKAETARQHADARKVEADDARNTAKVEAANAGIQAERATAEKNRAEASLQIARRTIRSALHDIGGNPRFADPEFAAFRLQLIESASAFYRQFSRHAGDDPAAVSDLAEVAHWLGYLEFLRGDMAAAATWYTAAAGDACRWASLDPADPLARIRKADSLLNAGRAHHNGKKFADAEARYREAILLAGAMVDEHPKKLDFAARLIETYPPLYELLREQRRWAEAADVCRAYLGRVEDSLRLFGPRINLLVSQGNARQCLGQMLDRTGQFDVAECVLLEAVEVRDQLAAGVRPDQPLPKGLRHADFPADAAKTRHALAQHYLFTNRTDRAAATIAQAVAILEPVAKANPEPRYAINLAEYQSLAGEVLRTRLELRQSQVQYDAAVNRIEALLKQPLPPALAAEARATWVRAVTGQAHLYNQTGRHRDAVAEWARLAKDDPNPHGRLVGELFVLQSLVFAGDRQEAAAGAEKLATRELPAWVWCDLGRVWCMIDRAAEADADLEPNARQEETDRAVANAVRCLETAKKLGQFRDDGFRASFERDRAYAPVRGKFDPRE